MADQPDSNAPSTALADSSGTGNAKASKRGGSGRDATPVEEAEPFDPFRFQSLPVSPDLRQELSLAKLPRLAPEYFEDTLPPEQAGAAPSAVPAPSSGPRSVALAIGIVAVLVTMVAAGLVHCMSEGAPHPPEAVPRSR